MESAKGKHILLVEDEVFIAMDTEQQLKSYGYAVSTAVNGEKAVEAIQNDPTIDLILMDINLGTGIDGTEAAQIILKDKDIPIVFLSSHTEPEVVEKTEKITSYGYVVKQSGIVVLDASIKMAFRLFDEKQRVREHRQGLSRANEELEKTNEELNQTNEQLEESNLSLAESEAKYRNIFESAPLGIFRSTPEGRFIEVNQTLAHMLGYDSPDTVLKEIHSIAEQIYIKKDERSPIVEKHLKEKIFTHHVNHYRRANGEEFIANLYLTTVRDDYSNIMYLEGIVEDITDQIKTENDLKKSQRIAHVGSWRLNVATNQVEWTEELYKMYGFNPLLPPPPYTEHMKLFTPESWELLTKSLDRTVKTGIPYELELKTVREDGSNGWMWVRGEAVKDVEGKTVELWGAAQDITKQKKLEDSLRRSEEFLNRTGELARVGGWEVELNTNKVFWTRATKIIHEVSMDYEPTLDEAMSFFPQESGQILTEAFERAIQTGEDYDLELDFVTAKKNRLTVRSIGHAEHVNGQCVRVYGTFQDITLRKEYDSHKTVEEAQYKILAQLHLMFGSHREDLFDFIIEASKEVTGSEFSFFGIMNEDETEMTIHAWSKNVLDSCAVTDQPIHFPIDKSGIWGDCVRERKTVIYNDYSETIATKHGTPEGHVPITRFIGIPVFEGDRIVAIGAVANKAEPYKQHDVKALSTIYARLWDIIMRYRAEVSLSEIEWLLSSSIKGVSGDEYAPPYGNVTELNTSRIIMDAVDRDLLHSIAADSIDLLDTSVAVYEKNGDYAFGMFSSGWCRLMDGASWKLCKTDDAREALTCGKWLCHENCWNDSAKQAIITGRPTDIECVGGIRLYCEPIFAAGEVVGVINIGYGTPPSDEATLKRLAEEFQVDMQVLKNASLEYRARPPYMIEIAKKRLASSALLIGTLVESAQYQRDLKERVKELHCLHDLAVIVEHNQSIKDILTKMPYILKEAMSYPAKTEVRIVFEKDAYTTDNYKDSRHSISADIIVKDEIEGSIEIVYIDTTENETVSVFLKEEHNLLTIVAERIGRIIERISLSNDYTYLLEMINEAIIFADSHGVIRTVNQAAADLCGYSSPEELIGNPMASLYPDSEARSILLKKLEEEGGEFKNFDFLLLKKDGSTVQTSCNIRLLKDSDGNITGTLGAVRDVTDLKHAEMKFRAITEQMNEFIAITDSSGFITYASPASRALFNESLDDMTGKHFTSYIDESSIESAVIAFRESLDDDKWTDNLELCMKRGDGLNFYGELNGQPFGDGTLVVIRDSTDRKLREEALKESEEQLKLVIKGSNDAPWDWDLVEDKLYYSPQWWRQLGYEPDELPADSGLWNRILHPDDKALVDEVFGGALEKGLDSYALEFNLKHKDGHYVPILTRGFISYDDNGKPLRVSGTNQDLTELKFLQNEIKNERDRMGLILASLNTGLSLIDRDMTIQWVNEKTREMFPGREPVGEKCYIFYESSDKVCEDCGIAESFLTGNTIERERFNRNNSRWFKIISNPVKDNSGNIIHVLAGIADITELKEREEVLQAAYTELELAQRIASIGNWSLDPEVGVPVWSEEIYRIYERDPAQGPYPLEYYKEIYSGKWWDIFHSSIQSAISEGRPYDIELFLQFPSGRNKWVHAICIPDPEPGPKGHILRGTIQDITEYKQMQEIIEKQVNEREILLKELNHRIKNSFMMITSMIRLNMSRVKDRDALEVMGDMKSRVDTMADLYSLLYEAGVSKDLQLDRYCHRIVQSLQGAHAVKAKSISFTFDYDQVKTDIKQASVIGMIVNEILTNSLKYAFPGDRTGEISISLKEGDDTLILDIRDNGIGLPKGFTPEKSDGFGMQLILGMIRQLDGELALTGDEGTRFIIRIPYE